VLGHWTNLDEERVKQVAFEKCPTTSQKVLPGMCHNIQHAATLMSNSKRIHLLRHHPHRTSTGSPTRRTGRTIPKWSTKRAFLSVGMQICMVVEGRNLWLHMIVVSKVFHRQEHKTAICISTQSGLASRPHARTQDRSIDRERYFEADRTAKRPGFGREVWGRKPKTKEQPKTCMDVPQ